MLGIKVGLLLVLVVSLSSLISDSYAESIKIEFDKSEYKTGEDLIISGSIEEFSMPIVAISIFDPTDKILSANNLELDENGNFSKIISLDSPFYEMPGIYTVKVDYKKNSLEDFFIINGEQIPSDPIEEPIIPEVVLLSTEKEVYTDGDTIEITGIVSTMETPSVLIGIYDPLGTPAGFYFGNIDDSLLFSASFLAKAGVNFKIDGVYSVKAHYAESELTSNFEFYQNLNSQNDAESSDNKTNPSDNKTKPSDKNENKNTKDKTVPIIQNDPKDQQNNEKKNGSKTETTTKESNPSVKSKSDQGNLTVEDIELGKLLNQINLECDRSKYVDTISYYDGMGPALYRLCKFESSLEFFDETISQDPTNVEALVNKGSALRKIGYSNEAINYFDRALKIDSNFVPALNNKANTLAIQGNYDEAVLLYAQALGKNPGYNTARQNMELVLSEMPVKTPSIQKQAIPVVYNTNDKDSIKTFDKDSIETFEPTWNSKSSTPQKEESSDIFEQIGSVFSSLGSIFGISN